MNPRRRRAALAAGALAAVAAWPAAASAVTPAVTGDDGNPVAITPGLAIRNMNATVSFGLATGEAYINATVVGPDGVQAASPLNCTSGTSRLVDYRGNGAYTVTVQAFGPRDFRCASPLGPPVTVQYTVSAGVALSGPRGRVLIRERNSFSTREIPITVALNPGASTTEVRVARGGVIGPDGGISGPSDELFVDRTTGIAALRLRAPGTYVVVARARGFSGSGTFYTPWSAPIVVKGVAPFDLDSVSFPDNRGPRYQLRGEVREETTRGRVRISIAPGSRGRFRPLATARVGGKGVFTARFTVRSPGTYRVRYRYAGSATTAPGEVVQRVRITRTTFFG
jgi:hypothetical protein